MKLSAFNKAVLFRLRLLFALTKFSLQEALAYPFNNWGGLISGLFYNLTFLAFLSIIFSRIKVIAGYNYGEILFFTLLSEVNFHLLWVWSYPNIRRLPEIINNGTLDVILSRPVPALFYVSLLRIRLASFIFESLPAIFPTYLITMRNFHSPVSPLGLIIGIITVLCGQLLLHCLHFIVTCFAFRVGEGRAISKLVEEISSFGESVPYEGFPSPLSQIGTTIIPILIASALSTSFILGKNTHYWLVVPVILLTAFFLYAKIKVWHWGLRNYSSASS